MANYYADCRSNYVKAKNPKRFKDFLSEYDVDIIEDSEERIGFISNAEEGIPSLVTDDGDYQHTIDEDERLPRLLAEGEVLVIYEIGREKMRYLIGYAVAINWDGRVCHVSLDDIYSRAEANFGNKPSTEASY